MRLMKAVGTVLLCLGVVWAKFDPCRFNFGAKLDTGNFGQVDIIAQYTWQGTGLESDIVQMLNNCKGNNKTPALYMYIIAKSSGLGDCNTGGGLCSEGANYIRNNKDKIKNIYKSYASSIKNTFGTNDPVILFMEPDYFQYAQPGSQNGNPLSFQEAGQFIGDCIDIVKAELPNALISLDVSPWIEDMGHTSSWLNALPLNKVQYMNTSGGVSQAGSSNIKGDNRLSWKSVHDITGKCIFADAGYGVGGGGTGHDNNWDNVSNINSRISDGVIGVIQFSPKSDWDNTLSGIKGQLNKPICPCDGIVKETYSLDITVGSGGKVSKNPDESSYEAGTSVTLTATPDNGFQFKEWGGDASGSNATITVTMDENKSITATFVDPDAKPTYKLTVNTSGSGVVEVTPNQTVFDSGTTVTLEAFSVNGGTFNGWGGALSGTTALMTVVMDGDKTVSASFSGEDVNQTNLVENGDFSSDDANWTFGAYDPASADGSVEGGAFKVAVQSPGSESWNIQLMQEGISLVKGEKYTLSFTASAQSPTTIGVNVGMPSGDYTSYTNGEKKIDLTTQPVEHTINFTMREESTNDARLEFNAGLSNSTWTVDNVSLTVQITIAVTEPAPFISDADKAVLLNGNTRATISWYDIHGRLLQQRSGEFTELMRARAVHFPGSYIAVLQVGKRRIIKRAVGIRR